MHSIVVPTYERSAYLGEALLSVLGQDFPPERYEVIVVDNSPTGEAQQTVEEVSEPSLRPVSYVREPTVGLHNARHAGARAAHGDILVYIDDDVIVHDGWLTAMTMPFADPRVACVGGKVLARWEAEPPVWWTRFDPGYLSLLDLGEEQMELESRTVHGCNMAVRRSVLYEVGGFNPDAIADRRLIWLRGDGEDGLQRRIRAAGYKVMYEPRAWLYHRIPAHRLTPQYFHWRAFIQGISDSYTAARKQPSRHRAALHSVGCFSRALQCCIRAVARRSNGRIRATSDAWYWYGRGQHQLRFALSRKLRGHVLQDTYL
jgi:glycosyltransferase involved in cell wall biosynthesis